MYRNNSKKVRTRKTCNIRTPALLSEFLFGMLNEKFDKRKLILDPCVGDGQLISPWKEAGYRVEGIDIEKKFFPGTRKMDYLLSTRKDYEVKPDLVLINPPFNVHKDVQPNTFEYFENNEWTRRPFLPEVFLSKTVELFGKNIPIVLFTPYGMRFNLTLESRRLERFDSGEYPEISSIITLPKNIYNFDKKNIEISSNKKGVIFHSEILLFNIEGLKGHYFLPRNLAKQNNIWKTS